MKQTIKQQLIDLENEITLKYRFHLDLSYPVYTILHKKLSDEVYDSTRVIIINDVTRYMLKHQYLLRERNH